MHCGIYHYYNYVPSRRIWTQHWPQKDLTEATTQIFSPFDEDPYFQTLSVLTSISMVTKKSNRVLLQVFHSHSTEALFNYRWALKTTLRTTHNPYQMWLCEDRNGWEYGTLSSVLYLEPLCRGSKIKPKGRGWWSCCHLVSIVSVRAAGTGVSVSTNVKKGTKEGTQTSGAWSVKERRKQTGKQTGDYRNWSVKKIIIKTRHTKLR